MNPSEKILVDFQTRVRQLILQFKQLKQENQQLQQQMQEQAQTIEELKARLTQADNDYQSLKMAKMMEITDGDLESAKVRIAKMIREVNKCIAILSDEQEQ